MTAAPTIVVTGPTCGGKTGLSAALAREFSWPILSLDSMKVYRGMDIGSAKPSRALRDELHFELLDLRDPWERFSGSEYLHEWKQVSARIEGPRVLSGGTVFYLNALREGLFEGPDLDPDLRASLDAWVDQEGLPALVERLRAVDPVAAARIHATDRRRLLRALEVFEQTGETLTVWQGRRTPILDPDRTLYLGVFREREELYARIDQRVERMFSAGWVEEVQQLRKAHDPPWSTEAAQSIGYARILTALEEGRDPKEEIERIQTRTHKFSRNQLTWVRKMPLEWWRPDETEDLLTRLRGWDPTGEIPTADEERQRRASLV